MKSVSLLSLFMLLLVAGITSANNTVDQPAQGEALQPLATPDLSSIIVPTVAPLPDAIAPTATPAIEADVLRILINARTDLEALANDRLGAGQRPAGWSGSLDVNNPQLAILIRLDLELLMAATLGLDSIPAAWFGPNPGTPYLIARDIRHDLELLAETLAETPETRPSGWAGDNPIMRCDRSTQNLALLLEREGHFIANVDPRNVNFCALVANQLASYTEGNLLTSSSPLLTSTAAQQPSDTQPEAPVTTNNGTHYAQERIGLAFLDRYATQRVGAMPTDIRFTPVARSYTQFSHMTLVRGDGFEVFMDYATTTMTEREFNVLPNVNDIGINSFCDAEWCHAPVILPGIGSGSGGRRGTLASVGLVNAGTNMNIYYDGDDRDGMTKVRMELCDRPTSTGVAICEAVTEVILPDGSASPAVGSVGGLAQFYVPYSYTTTSVRSRNFHTADLWIDPPKTRR